MTTPKNRASKKERWQGTQKFTEEQVIRVEALVAYLTVAQIADYLSVGITTFYEIMERQPEVCESYKKGKTKSVVVVVKQLMKNIQEGKEGCIIFFLKTRDKWSEKVEVVDKDDVLIQHNVAITDKKLLFNHNYKRNQDPSDPFL